MFLMSNNCEKYHSKQEGFLFYNIETHKTCSDHIKSDQIPFFQNKDFFVK